MTPREHSLRLALPGAVPLRAAPLAAGALVVFWALLMAAQHPAQFADSIEQYSWAHSLEWGYWKHPPLTTWMMRGAIAVIGVSHWTGPVLAALCLAASVAFMWQVAQALLPPRAAQLAIVLWPLHQALTFRAEVYNHNTVVVLFSSAIAWAALRATGSGRTRDWLLAGGVAGLGLLAKYQALMTIAGVLVALALTGRLRSPALRRQLWLAAAVGFALFLPHLRWLIQESLTTLGYVEGSARHLHLFARLPALFRFASVQVLMIAGMLLVAAVAMYWPARAVTLPADDAPREDTRAWMLGLAGVPLVVVAAAVLLGGFTPQKMWGVQTLEFLPLWLAWRIARARPGVPIARRAAIAAGLLTLANIGYALIRDDHPADLRARFSAVDRLMPAGELAQAAVADWRRATSCPLRFVTGNVFPAGLVSVYSGEYPVVVEEGDFTKTPWVRPDDLTRAGAIDVHGPVSTHSIPQDVSFVLVPASTKNEDAPSAVWWHVIRPGSACG